VFADIMMGLMAAALGYATWASIRQSPPNYFVTAILGFFTILCFMGLLTQKRRTFTFDKSNRTMTWTSSGLRENASGSVEFSDITISLDGSMIKGTTYYRLLIDTPTATLPLTNSYSLPLKRAEEQSAHLRELIGRPEKSVVEDSIAALSQQHDVIVAATMRSGERTISTVQAFDDPTQQKKTTEDPSQP